MTRRSALAPRSRPLSAIFIGSTPNPSPPAIPDLPEPPSPSSSVDSGLPSPPATNSTGSGSVDDSSTNAGSLRQRLASLSNSSADMSNGIHDKSYGNSRNRLLHTDDEDDQDDHENDEDDTARLSDGRRPTSKAGPSDDNMSALQRVKNLTQRNRMVLDKLSSISRLSSPAPSTNSRSPFSPPTASSSSSSSRLSSTNNRPQSASNPLSNGRRLEPSQSGSETERESQNVSSHSYPSSDDLSATPPSAYPQTCAPHPTRERRISAPASPGKVGRPPRDRNRGPSPGPSRTPRKRISMAMSVDEGYRNVQREDEEDVTAAALAAVASSRRSPTSSGGKKTRQPLPREFRERDRRGSDGKQPNGEPSTPHRHRDRSLVGRASPSPKKGTGSTYSDPSVHTSPRRPGASRFSTVRELTRKHQTRWLSEDLSASADGEDDAAVQYSSGSGGSGRRQGHRNGSSDGLLIPSGGRSLVGEGLRAAGITKRKDTGDDPFVSGSGDNGTRSPRRTKSTGNSSVANGEWDTSMEQSEGARSSTHLGEGVGLSRRLDPRTPAAMSHKPNDRGNYTAGILSRPGTSMAALHHESIDNPPPRTAPPALRSYKSTYLQDRDRGKNASPQVQQEPVQQRSSDRAYSSPFTTFRSSTAPLTGLGRDSNAEHRRLMLDSLGMFESHLSRLPPMGQITTNTIPELFQSAQHLVHTLDRLNSMLKTGTNKALEAQIDAEVTDQQDGIDLVDLWRQVGSDHRENLRMSDEVVRNMTGFLLGVGKVLREYSALSGQHMRSVSLDEEMTRKLTPEVGASSSGKESEGRRSRETRRSWDPAQRDSSGLLTRLSSRERNGTGARPGSSLNMLRSSGASSSEGRSVADAVGEQTPPTTLRNNVSALAASSSIRRLYTPRERSTPNVAPIMASFESRDSLQSYEPSPTPTSRHAQSAISDRPRAFPPLAVPPSLSTLPSESLLNRNSTVSDKPNRRKVSSNSNITVRAEPSAFSSVLRPPNATTALTTHNVLKSNSPAPGSANSPHSLLRSESSGSARTNGVTFSRPSTISSSTLSNLQQQHERVMRGRAESNASSILDESPVTLAPAAMISPLSGSETERDARRRTLGARPRISLDSALEEAAAEVMNASQAATLLSSAGRKERRRTITEIFQR